MRRSLMMVGMLILLSGCIDTPIYGTYSNNGSTFVLQEDNTYLYTPAGGMTQKGTFTQNGDEIQISNILGMTTIVKIVKDGLIDDDGILWSRK